MARFFNLHVLVVGLVTGIATAGDVWFEGIGHLPGHQISGIRAISANGIAAGLSQDFHNTPVLWTRDDGLVVLPFPPGASTAEPYAISDDGAVIAGTAGYAGQGFSAFRWSPTEGAQDLGRLGQRESHATDVSGDGATIVGRLLRHDFMSRPFKWTADGGMIELPVGGASSLAAGATNHDGSVIVGDGVFNNQRRAVRWIGNSEPESLGALQGYGQTFSNDVSDDGSVIIGGANVLLGGFDATVWREGSGWTVLGDLPGGDRNAVAYSLSPDTTTILGYGTTELGVEAFVWTESSGMRRLTDVLWDDYGLDTAGWRLELAWFSADGSMIGGRGMNPDGHMEGFVAQIPEPALGLPILTLLILVSVRSQRGGSTSL